MGEGGQGAANREGWALRCLLRSLDRRVPLRAQNCKTRWRFSKGVCPVSGASQEEMATHSNVWASRARRVGLWGRGAERQGGRTCRPGVAHRTDRDSGPSPGVRCRDRGVTPQRAPCTLAVTGGQQLLLHGCGTVQGPQRGSSDSEHLPRVEIPAQGPVLKDDVLSRLLCFCESRSQQDLSSREGLYGHQEKMRLSDVS